MIRHPQVKLYHPKPQIFKHIEILKVSDRPTYFIPLKSSLEITDFHYHHHPTPSGETTPSQTSNL